MSGNRLYLVTGIQCLNSTPDRKRSLRAAPVGVYCICPCFTLLTIHQFTNSPINYSLLPRDSLPGVP